MASATFLDLKLCSLIGTKHGAFWVVFIIQTAAQDYMCLFLGEHHPTRTSVLWSPCFTLSVQSISLLWGQIRWMRCTHPQEASSGSPEALIAPVHSHSGQWALTTTMMSPHTPSTTSATLKVCLLPNPWVLFSSSPFLKGQWLLRCVHAEGWDPESVRLELGMELSIFHFSCTVLSSGPIVCLEPHSTVISLFFFSPFFLASLSQRDCGQLQGKDQVSHLWVPLGTIFALKTVTILLRRLNLL